MVKGEKIESFIMNLEIAVKDREEEKKHLKTDKQKWVLEFCFYKMRYRKEKCVFQKKAR